MRNKQMLAATGILMLAGVTLTGVAQNQRGSFRSATPSGTVTRQMQNMGQPQILDTDGDGRCDVSGKTLQNGNQNQQGQNGDKGKRWGPGDGSGQKENPPKDGTGYGSGNGKANGPQDGSGNKQENRLKKGGKQGGNPQPGTGQPRGRGKGRGRS